jgi:PAS domain S-box-containing protein
VVWAIVRATGVRDDAGNLAYWLGIMEDITERRRAEIAVKESEARYRTIFNNANEAILVADIATRQFCYANPAACELLQYSTEELRTIKVDDIHPPEARAEVLKRFEAQAQGDQLAGRHVPCLRKDGSVVFCDINAAVMMINGIHCNVGFFQDTTARRQVEAALRASEERYRSILEHIGEGYYEVDPAGNFTFFNDGVSELLGYTPQQLGGMNYRGITSGETTERMHRLFNQVYQSEQPSKISEFDLITASGEKKPIEISILLMRDQNGTPNGFRGIMRDVSDRHQAEAERERLTTQIQQSQKMEAIGTLAGGIAHDFNNLLMGIQGNVSLILLDKEKDQREYEYLKNIENLVLRGSELTRQILGFARGGKYRVKPTDLNLLVGKTADMFSRTKREITMHQTYQSDLWSVDVDQGQIEQVLLNLFVNAWQAMPEGGDLYITTENIALSAKDQGRSFDIVPGKYVRVSVTDTGTGMEKNIQGRIFEPFFTTKEVGRGTGLGLASAYGIVKNHNGVIRVYSEIGHGTTFRIYLPATSKPLQQEPANNGKVLKGSGTILLVDDEPAVAEVGKDMVEKLGYQVLLATGGEQAISIFRKYRKTIRLVILDMIMPGMSGGETYDRIKALDPDARVLLASGYGLNGQATEFMKRGCNGFIQKPFNLRILSQKIRTILDAK